MFQNCFGGTKGGETASPERAGDPAGEKHICSCTKGPQGETRWGESFVLIPGEPMGSQACEKHNCFVLRYGTKGRGINLVRNTCFMLHGEPNWLEALIVFGDLVRTFVWEGQKRE